MEKICKICSKPFTTESNKIGKCKECKRLYDNQFYKDNKHKYAKSRKAGRRVYRLKMQSIAWEYLTSHPCIDCGESDPVVLEFDHKSKTHKSCNVSLLARFFGEEKIRAEINKCEVRCANCHRRKTAKQEKYNNIIFYESKMK